jgi:RimJ/RimL family protein N-acetyltransferase
VEAVAAAGDRTCTVKIRRARPEDADFLVELLTHEEVEPYLAAVRPNDRESVLAGIERSQREPAEFGVFLIEVDGQPAGVMEFERANRRSRIAHLGGLAVHPDFRGQRLSDQAAREFQRHLLLDLGYHRLQLEVYGFNERALRHAERVGYVREGVKRKAYRRHGEWVDGVMYALLREDLGLSPALDFLYEYVARHNAGVRDGEWGPLAECFADAATLEFEGVAVGPFAGREAIAAAYEQQPPDDEVRILDAEEEGGAVVARYAWAAAAEVEAGSLRLTREGDKIARLVVRVSRP